MQNDKISPSFCLQCGGPMPTRTRLQGKPPKTCSEKCRIERHRALERERYHTIRKNSDDWKASRALYLKKRAEFLKKNPFEREAFLKRARLHTKNHRQKLMSNSEAWSKVLLDARNDYHEMMNALKEQAMGLVAYRFKKRRWYNSLSAEDKQRLYRVKIDD